MDAQTAALLQAVGDSFREQVERVENRALGATKALESAVGLRLNGITGPPEIHVTNDVPAPSVEVHATDLAPLVEAVLRLAKAQEAAAKELAELRKLEARIRTLEQQVANHPRTNLRIRHGDGTESLVSEEVG